MGRRRKSSVFEDLVDITAMLPWWVGASLALASYLYLSHYVAQPLVPVVAGKPTSFIAPIFSGLAVGLQYIFPLVFGTGAVISLFKQIKRRSLFNSASSKSDQQLLDGKRKKHETIDSRFSGFPKSGKREKRETLFNSASSQSGKQFLNGISWQEFEELVGEFFRRKGYAVTETGGSGPDGGVDLVLLNGDEKTLVQCKQWRSYRVGVKIVRELYGVMAAEGAAAGYVVTSGQFTADAIRFANGREIELIDGENLNRLIREIKYQRKPVVAVDQGQSGMVPNFETPACPNCGAQMVKRTARQGQHVGKQFWGCSDFPRCRGIRSFASAPNA